MKKYESESKNGRKCRPESYLDELRRRESGAVNEAFSGGAYGCPGEYFRGAAAMDCRGEFRVICKQCWSSAYEGEEWVPPQRRDL